MADKLSGQLELFLKCLDKAFSENLAEPLKCCSIQPEFLSLLTLGILSKLLEILESDTSDDNHIRQAQERVQEEIVFRHLIRIPRDFHELHSFLQRRFPQDALTEAIPELIQIADKHADNWIKLESALLSRLRTLRKDNSRLDYSIGKVLDIFSSESKNRASAYIIFVRRSSDKSDDNGLHEKYLMPAFVRRVETVGTRADANQIFSDVATEIDPEIKDTALTAQWVLLGEQEPEQSRKYFIQYRFVDSLSNLDCLYLEGRSAGLAFAYLTYAYANSEYVGFKSLSPYVACFGALVGRSIIKVDGIEEKINAAREHGIRILILPKSSLKTLDDIKDCKIIEYKPDSLDKVLAEIHEPTIELAENLLLMF